MNHPVYISISLDDDISHNTNIEGTRKCPTYETDESGQSNSIQSNENRPIYGVWSVSNDDHPQINLQTNSTWNRRTTFTASIILTSENSTVLGSHKLLLLVAFIAFVAYIWWCDAYPLVRNNWWRLLLKKISFIFFQLVLVIRTTQLCSKDLSRQ